MKKMTKTLVFVAKVKKNIQVFYYDFSFFCKRFKWEFACDYFVLTS